MSCDRCLTCDGCRAGHLHCRRCGCATPAEPEPRCPECGDTQPAFSDCNYDPCPYRAATPAEPTAGEVAYVNNYIEGRDAAIRESLLAHFGDMVGRQAAADTIDAAFRAALDNAMEDLT